MTAIARTPSSPDTRKDVFGMTDFGAGFGRELLDFIGGFRAQPRLGA